ncbi:hypothetical protein [Paenibacillus sp. FSL E2-0178]|uniref:hypothetical protein n=1 Tax=Paenibacillus sp. FSL E2-0178 TaxID=2921361 RepID=UPI0031590D62
MKKNEKMPEEIKRKISKTLTGHAVSESTREKLQIAFLGVPRDPAVVENLRKKLKGKRKGIKFSEDHKNKLKKARQNLLNDPVKGAEIRRIAKETARLPDSVWEEDSLVKRRGENHGMAKLNWNKVDEIRDMKKNGMTNSQIHEEVSATYDVALSTIKAITTFRNWKPENRPYKH